MGLSGICFAPVSGYLADRIHRRKPVFVLGCLAVASLLLGLIYVPSGAALVALTLAMGVFYLVFAQMFAIIPTLAETPQQEGTAFGVVTLFVSIAGIVGSPVVGYVFGVTHAIFWPLDHAGSICCCWGACDS